jgi:ribonuclease D
MSDAELPPPVWVDTAQGLEEMAAQLAAQPVIAVDTESNSLHAYRERVCLIQFSTPTTDYVLDPLALDELSTLGPIFANPAIEKVFHAAEYDLICLRRDFGWQVHSLFDTMVAVRTLGWPQNGLAATLESQFNVSLNKRHQRADWGARPLTADQLAYARMDTHYLIPLRDKLITALSEVSYLAEAREEFERLAQVNGNGRAAPVVFDPQNFWYIGGARDLTSTQAAILRELYIYREQTAERIDRPPFKVIADATLMEIAKLQPITLDDLVPVNGMTERQISRHGYALLQAVARGQKAAAPRPLRVEHEDEAVLDRFETLRKWRKARALARGVESDVIVPKDVLMDIARRAPQTMQDLDAVRGLGPTRREKYGEEIVKLMQPKPRATA